MGRRPRINFSGAIYHVMARGVDGRDIFADDIDRKAFLDGMRRIEREASAEILAYCLMGNHFHIAVKIKAVPLASIMQRLLTSYCMRFNRRHERTGHLFQARYKAILCLDDRYLLGLIRYIHMNPVRAGLVSSPQDWPWSSYRPVVGIEAEYADFKPWPTDVSPKIELARRADDEFAGLEAIGAAVASDMRIDLDVLRRGVRCRSVVSAKRLFARDAVRNGHALIAIAKWLNISLRSVSRYARENTV